jgi:hypothetical protein
LINIASNSDKIAYGIKHFNLDEIVDLPNLNKSQLTPGSTVFIIENSKYYMLNGSKKWVEINPFGKTIISGDGETEDNPVLPPEEDEEQDDIIYDGGII